MRISDLSLYPSYLSYGFVRLVDSHGSDLSIANAARVSYGDGSKGREKDKKLLRYLLANRHTSPFEHVSFTFHVKTPLFVARQWMRHRTWSFNEISYRYTQPTLEFYVPKSWRGQSGDNKQMSAGDLPHSGQVIASRAYAKATREAVVAYRTLIEAGVSRELARTTLPVSVYTEFYGTVNLHNLLHFLGLRLHEHAQQEIREYAEDIVGLIEPVVPDTLEIWRTLNAPNP